MILIFGATGYIGRYLCLYLKQRGYDVLALGRSKNVFKFFDDNNIRYKYFDFTDEKYFSDLPTANIKAVVNLSACLAEHETPVDLFFNVNTVGTYKLLEFCRAHGIQKFILTSTHKLYNDIYKEIISEKDTPSFRGDHSPYIISKLAAEKMLEYYNKDFNMSGICLRLTGVHGYGEILGFLKKNGAYTKSTFEIFIEKAISGEPITVWGNQNIKRDHIYIKDVLTAIEAAIVSDGVKGVFNIASGVGYSLYEEACAIAKVFAQDEDKESIITVDETKQGLSRGYVYDIGKAVQALNWHPQYTDIVEMLNDYKKEWQKKLYHNYHYIDIKQRPVTL